MDIKKTAMAVFIFAFTIIYSSVCFCAPWIDMDITYDGRTQKYNAETVYLYINGKKNDNLSMPPIILNNSTLVPAREVFEPLGAEIKWDNDKKEMTVIYKSYNIVIKTDSMSAMVNGEETSLVSPAKIINGKTMIPARFIAQSIGMTVEWSKDTRIVNIRETPQTNADVIELDPDDSMYDDETTQEEEFSQETTDNNDYNDETSREEESLQETTTERPPVKIEKIDCKDGAVKISAEGSLGDFALKESSDKKITYILSRTILPDKEKYTFDDEYVKDVTFEKITIKGKNFTQAVLRLKKYKKPASYISKDSKSLIIDFVNKAPDYEDLYVTELNEEPLASDSDISEENDGEKTKASNNFD